MRSGVMNPRAIWRGFTFDTVRLRCAALAGRLVLGSRSPETRLSMPKHREATIGVMVVRGVLELLRNSPAQRPEQAVPRTAAD